MFAGAWVDGLILSLPQEPRLHSIKRRRTLVMPPLHATKQIMNMIELAMHVD